MRTWTELLQRIVQHGGLIGHDKGLSGCAAKVLCAAIGRRLQVIASWGDGWDHVSVTRVSDNRPPFWADMAWIKDLFFLPDEVAMQLHPASKNYVNNHPGCLHIWRPHDQDIPLPPTIMV